MKGISLFFMVTCAFFIVLGGVSLAHGDRGWVFPTALNVVGFAINTYNYFNLDTSL